MMSEHSEPAREVIFPDYPTAVADWRRRSVAFPARVDGQPVMCLVSSEALAARSGLAALEDEEALAAFHRNREAIQEQVRVAVAGTRGVISEVCLTRAGAKVTARD
jgi:hypothetical protein